MENLIRKPTFLLIVLLLGFLSLANAQQLSDELHSKLSASDQKKIQKADELKLKGNQLLEEADKTFDDAKKAESKRLESSRILQESANAKYKVYVDNSKSFWKNFSGDKTSLNDVKNAENTVTDSFKLAEEVRKKVSKEKMFEYKLPLLQRAESIERNAVLKMQKVLYTYLNWPVSFHQDWLNSGDPTLPKQTPAVQETKLTPAQTKPAQKPEEIAGNDSSIYGIVKVNEEQIDMFNEFLKKSYPAEVENYVINYRDLDFSDLNKLRAAWNMYQHGIVDSSILMASFGQTPADSSVNEATQTEIAQAQDSTAGTKIGTTTVATTVAKAGTKTSATSSTATKIADKQTVGSGIKTVANATSVTTGTSSGNTANTIASNTNSNNKGTAKTSTSTAAKTNKQPVQISEKQTVAIERGSATANENSNSFIYRVQIVACRVPLDEKTLHGIYNGPEQIIELQEESWYKYAIGTYSTYKAARQFVERSKIPGSFVIAYLNGKRIKITPAFAFRKSAATEPSGLKADLIEFRVQIAASKAQLSDNLLANIYGGSLNIDIISEEGWYKYSILAGKTFDDAKKMLKQVNVPGAFIVAYHQKTKIDLSSAIRITKQ